MKGSFTNFATDAMEATVFVCVVTAIACALLTLDGAGEEDVSSSHFSHTMTD